MQQKMQRHRCLRRQNKQSKARRCTNLNIYQSIQRRKRMQRHRFIVFLLNKVKPAVVQTLTFINLSKGGRGCNVTVAKGGRACGGSPSPFHSFPFKQSKARRCTNLNIYQSIQRRKSLQRHVA